MSTLTRDLVEFVKEAREYFMAAMGEESFWIAHVDKLLKEGEGVE